MHISEIERDHWCLYQMASKRAALQAMLAEFLTLKSNSPENAKILALESLVSSIEAGGLLAGSNAKDTESMNDELNSKSKAYDK